MTKTKAILVAAFLVTLAAGFAVGYTLRSVAPHRHDRPWLVYLLSLTPEQRDQMKAVWQEADGSLHAISERLNTLRNDRRDAVTALLTGAQAMHYDAIQQEFQKKSDELGQERRKVLDQAHAKTDSILTPVQRKKYQELVDLMREGPGRDPRPAGEAGKPPLKSSGTAPAGGGPEPGKTGEQPMPHGGA